MTFLTVLICAVLYAVKGGSGNVFKNWNKVRDKSLILDRLLDGKVLSTLLMGIFCIFATQDGVMTIALMTAWIVAVSPSMGEEHGAIGDYKGALPMYIERALTQRGRSYDIKKGLQRGVFMGASFAVVTGFTGFIIASLLFVPCVYIGQSLNRILMKVPGWTLAEPLIGGIVIGIPLGIYLGV